MATEKAFLNPKLEGRRFDDHALPVDLLEDFSALEELIFELARKIYKEQNPKRKRVPNHFTDNVSLKIKSIEEGSVIPNIIISIATSLSSPSLPAQNNDYFKYFEAARDKVFEIVESSNNGKPTGIGVRYLNYFNRIGRNLKDDESINFVPNSSDHNFTKTTRKRILLSKSDNAQYTDFLTEKVLIRSIDAGKKNFTIELNGHGYECSFKKEFETTIFTALQGYEKKALVAISAIGIYDDQDKLTSIMSIDSMELLDPYDVSLRLEALAELPDKWYDGSQGKKLNIDALEIFEAYFLDGYNDNLPLPAIFPTLTGNLLLEWKNSNLELSVEVDLDNFTAQAFYFDMDSQDDDQEQTLDLKSGDAWRELNAIVLNLTQND